MMCVNVASPRGGAMEPRIQGIVSTLSALETKTDKFANNVGHDDPTHLDLHCLPSSL